MPDLTVQTSSREEILDITPQVTRIVAEKAWKNGALHIYCQHTTCGLTINEGADPDVRRDLMRFFQEIAPRIHDWQHREGNTDAHIRSSLLGVSLLVPVENGRLMLGTWQSIYLYDGDGPRRRHLLLQFFNAV